MTCKKEIPIHLAAHISLEYNRRLWGDMLKVLKEKKKEQKAAKQEKSIQCSLL
jgi:hypothetical protein